MSINNEAMRLQQVKSTIDRARIDKTRAETQLEQCDKRDEEIRGQLAAPELHSSPETIAADMEAARAEVAKYLNAAEQALLPPAPLTAQQVASSAAVQGGR